MFIAITNDRLAAILSLNNAHAVETSLLTHDTLAAMVEEAFLAEQVGEADGFLIAFRQGADYDSPNLTWFEQHYDRFAYVDRIVVAPTARGRGLAKALYERLFDRARDDGLALIACEVNVDPPNPASLAFHAAMGFEPVGEATLPNGKRVRYMVRSMRR